MQVNPQKNNFYPTSLQGWDRLKTTTYDHHKVVPQRFRFVYNPLLTIDATVIVLANQLS